MKNPPLIQAMFAVMVLGILNMQMKGWAIGDLPMRQLAALAIALIGTSVVVTPFVAAKKNEAVNPEEPKRSDDDLDMSA